MANSRFEYVRSYEQPDSLLPNTYVVVRIDGRGFTKLTAKYQFVKPNDRRALDLMNMAAEAVMKELPDLVLAYGQSDEFSFVFHRDCMLFERRASKLTSTIVSTFTANYVFAWNKYFPDTPLTHPLPSFDGRTVCYPCDTNLRDYLSWRQVDCHINNLYNTSFWALVQKGGMEPRAAEQELSGTVSAEKNELLFSRFGINYNNEPDIFKKGSVLYRDFFPTSTQSSPTPPKTAQSPSPPLSHPRPQRPVPRPMSQPLERTIPGLLRDSPASEPSDAATPRGPTFLSTSTTPSPPPSPPSFSMPTVANHLPRTGATFYPQTFMPASPPANGSASRQPWPQLTPLPIPPPTLKPSTRPPPSLTPPNLTAYTNFSPLPSPEATRSSIPERRSSITKQTSKRNSHSASASLSQPVTTATATRQPLPKRSPSMSIIELGPPPIPLRISSIPMNASPRKLSLPSQKSYSMLKAEEKENALSQAATGGAKTSPPLRTMKELPSPPVDDVATRNAVMGEEPPGWSVSPLLMRKPRHARPDTENRTGNSSPLSPPPRSTRRAQSHSRLHSAPPPTLSQFHALTSHPPSSSKLAEKSGLASFDWATSHPKKEKTKVSKKSKSRLDEDGGWAAGTQGEGRPVQLSKTQRDKEKKKRTKAKVVIEHVDIIKEGFWERRPWILSGRAG